jgi:hypothetical protein
MSVDRWEALRELAKKATPGPWEWIGHMLRADGSAVIQPTMNVAHSGAYLLAAPADKEYTAAANPSEILALLAAYDALAEREGKLRQALRGCRCPRPANDRPDEWTVGACVDALECGCSDGKYAAHDCLAKESP